MGYKVRFLFPLKFNDRHLITFPFAGDYSSDYFHNPSESSRFSQMLSQQQQNQNHARQQPNGIHSSDHVYPANMSKFFDFHKVQQQQQQNQQQNQYFNNSSRSDHMNVSNLMENHRNLNSQFVDHTLNGELLLTVYLSVAMCSVGWAFFEPQNCLQFCRKKLCFK